jgi:hypothetical protein
MNEIHLTLTGSASGVVLCGIGSHEKAARRFSGDLFYHAGYFNPKQPHIGELDGKTECAECKRIWEDPTIEEIKA